MAAARFALIITTVLTVLLHAQVYRGYSGENETQNKRSDNARRQETRGYYENGALHYIMEYKRGRVDGDAKEYYENGVLKAEIRFQNNRRDGFARYYYESGTLRAKIQFKRDIETGKNKFYAPDGELMRTAVSSVQVRSIVEDLAAGLPKPQPRRQKHGDTSASDSANGS